MRLDQWIKQIGGATKAARLLDVSLRSIHQWKTYQNLPSDRVKMKIVKLSRGRCSYKDIIEPYYARSNTAA